MKKERKKKTVFIALGMVSLLTILVSRAEADDLAFLISLPLPELSPLLLEELSAEMMADNDLFDETPFDDEAREYLSEETVVTVPYYEETPIELPPRPLRTVASLENIRMKHPSPPVIYGRIPGIEHPLTQQYIAQYSTPRGIEFLNSVMQRGSMYFAFIRKEVEARNLPTELMYLPVVESSFLSTAVSRAGAVGLWQFMKNSIEPFDMKVTEWMDERIDFWKSTMGALSKLEGNYNHLQDWALALAAYNAGLGGVSRTMQRTGINNYWRLSELRHLPTETIHYVPKLLAVHHILSNPRLFGIDAMWHEDPEWTRIRIGRMVDIELLGTEAGINVEELKRANSELFYNITPPDPNYYLKVRAADADAIKAVLDRKDFPLLRYYFHTIAAGDTLSEIARHYGVSVDTIMNTNPGLQPRFLRLGTRLLIPAYRDVEPYQKPRRTTAPVSQTEGTYIVRPGDTLWSIARAHQTTPEALARVNNMGMNDILREGRLLKLR